MGKHDTYNQTESHKRRWSLTSEHVCAVLSRVNPEELLIGGAIALGFVLSFFV